MLILLPIMLKFLIYMYRFIVQRNGTYRFFVRKQYVPFLRTYRFFVQRNGAYRFFLRTYHFFVRRNGMYIRTISSYKETVCTVSTYLPFLCTKKRYVLFLRTKKRYLQRNGMYGKTASSINWTPSIHMICINSQIHNVYHSVVKVTKIIVVLRFSSKVASA